VYFQGSIKLLGGTIGYGVRASIGGSAVPGGRESSRQELIDGVGAWIVVPVAVHLVEVCVALAPEVADAMGMVLLDHQRNEATGSGETGASVARLVEVSDVVQGVDVFVGAGSEPHAAPVK